MSNEKNIRSSQLVSTFGIGQITNFPNDVSVLIGGINLWEEEFEARNRAEGNMNWDALKLHEPRLQRALKVKYFVKPFEYRKKASENKMLHIPSVRFPGWHHCVKCGIMARRSLGYNTEPAKCECGSKMIPVRFVAACQAGHIQDVPFEAWVHDGESCGKGSPKLTYRSFAGSGDLSSISISCHCGKKRSLAGLMNVSKDNGKTYNSALASIGFSGSRPTFDNPNDLNPKGEYCLGHKPWLGVKGVKDPDTCGGHLHVLIRGGTNVHYSMVRSSLFLPQAEDKSVIIETILSERKDDIEEFWEADKSRNMIKVYLRGIEEVKSEAVTVDEIIAYIENQQDKKDDNDDITEHQLRFEEYSFILSGSDIEGKDFKATSRNLENYLDSDFLEKYIDKVVLIEKLKETRVFTGFRRIESYNIPGGNNLQQLKSQLSTEGVEWLPATVVFGEGIFIKFRDDVLDEWLQSIGSKLDSVINRHHSAMQKRYKDYVERPLSASFLMMHTFAHLLIKRLCFNCGYGTSSLRERIYYSQGEERMNGIMIYTSSGDSEGSLGGLVKQGTEEFFGKLFREAIEDARWCSADPVCSDIGQRAGQGPDNVNGSACHNCAILPETSCEEFNQLLDRATVTGTIDNPELAFFKD